MFGQVFDDIFRIGDESELSVRFVVLYCEEDRHEFSRLVGLIRQWHAFAGVSRIIFPVQHLAPF